MLAPNGSIANLSVTRKSLGASIDKNSKAGVLFNFLLSLARGFAGLSRSRDSCGALTKGQNKSRRLNGAGLGSNDF
jgi:hypothetical protein